MWRYAVYAVILLAVLTWLYPRPAAEYSADVTEVTVWFNGIIEGRHIDVVDAFERVFPEYRAVLGSSAVRSGLESEGSPQRLMCGIAGGVPPEVVEYDRFAICQWAARRAFLDLTPFVEKDAQQLAEAREKLDGLKQQNAPQADIVRQQALVDRLETFQVRRDDYYPATWDECMYRGGLYGIPNYMDDRALYYNSDLLVRAGFVNDDGSPRPPQTWEQVLTKRIDVQDAHISGETIRSQSADYVAAGVQPGDTLSHISHDGQVVRCLVDRVVGPNELIVRSAYANRRLNLRSGQNQHVKIFDQSSYTLRLSQWDDDGQPRCVGFEPQQGNGWLFHYGWANGGEFMSEDGRTCTLNDPRIVEALEFTTDVYDALGGVQSVNAFKKSFQTAAQDPFYLNQIGLFIHGDWFLRDLARYKRDMRFGTCPAPVPAHRLEQGHDKVTWLGGLAYCIPATCPPEKREAAWWFIKYLSSIPGGMIMNEHDAQREHAQGRLYMPRLMASKKLNELQLETYVRIPQMPERLQAAIKTHVDLLPFARYRPVSPEGFVLWNAQADAQDLAWNHRYTPAESLDINTQRVQRALDKFHAPKSGRPVQWSSMFLGYLGLLALVALFLWIRYRIKHPASPLYRKEWRAGALFASPWMIGFIVLAGGPMIFSLVMSFTEYDVISDARFVGWSNYEEMFLVDWDTVGGVKQSLLNTLYMAIGLPLSMVVGLALAMLLAANVRGMSVYRTMFFLPAIMPVVAASVLWIWVFNAQNGLMNWMLDVTGIETLLEWMGVRTPIGWLTNKDTSKPALIIMTLWGAGASMIIWLAGLKEIPEYLYEAASLDGAGPVRRFFTVTLPMLSPYILFNLTMGLIATFQIFTQAYIMTPNGSPERSTYFYVYKLFDECFSYFRLGYGAAMAWVLFAIVIVVTLINMALSKKWVHYAGE